MNEMIERVARALALRSLKRCAEGFGEIAGQSAWVLQRPQEIASHIDSEWPRFAEDARAAIEAMREPTVAMATHARSVDRAHSPDYWLVGPAEEVWRDMIDAALKH